MDKHSMSRNSYPPKSLMSRIRALTHLCLSNIDVSRPGGSEARVSLSDKTTILMLQHAGGGRPPPGAHTALEFSKYFDCLSWIIAVGFISYMVRMVISYTCNINRTSLVVFGRKPAEPKYT